MLQFRLPLAALATLAIVACSGGSSTSSGAASSAPASAAAQAVQGPLPVYPGATALSAQMPAPISVCGHKMTMAVYRVPGGDADTIAGWYAGKMDGAMQIKNDATYGSIHAHHVMVISGDGSEGATVIANTYPPGMQKVMTQSRGAGVQLALATYDPAFTRDEMDLYARAANGDAAAKAQAMAAFKAKCGSGFKMGT